MTWRFFFVPPFVPTTQALSHHAIVFAWVFVLVLCHYAFFFFFAHLWNCCIVIFCPSSVRVPTICPPHTASPGNLMTPATQWQKIHINHETLIDSLSRKGELFQWQTDKSSVARDKGEVHFLQSSLDGFSIHQVRKIALQLQQCSELGEFCNCSE